MKSKIEKRQSKIPYRGRIAPSPTGYLHLGHAATFSIAHQRARAAAGKLVLRIEDIDVARCRPEFRDALIEDLEWLGIEWDEGPYLQTNRLEYYRDAFEQLKGAGVIYPCICSRKDVSGAATAPHDDNAEPIYPGTCRNRSAAPVYVNWRFRVPDGETITFVDEHLGQRTGVAGRDFGDFIVWRRDDLPAYQLAVVVDDAAMQISEVVRGEDLVISTFRQLLVYRSLGRQPPRFYHTPLLLDGEGRRLAKRHQSLTLRALRASGRSADEVRAMLSAATTS